MEWTGDQVHVHVDDVYHYEVAVTRAQATVRVRWVSGTFADWFHFSTGQSAVRHIGLFQI